MGEMDRIYLAGAVVVLVWWVLFAQAVHQVRQWRRRRRG